MPRLSRISVSFASFAGAAVVSCSTLIGIEDRPLGDPHPKLEVVGEGGIVFAADGGGTPLPFPAPRLEPPGCDSSPTVHPEVLEERCGVFVAPPGTDTNPGTKNLPLQSLAAAIAKARDLKLYRVFACSGIYPEHVTMTGNGVSIVGGLTCDARGWTVGPEPSIVRPADEGPAVSASNVPNAFTLERLRFEAQPGSKPSASTIVIRAETVASFGLSTCELSAAAGRSGDDGAAGVLGTGGGTPGNAAGGGGSVLTQGPEVSCSCTLNGNAAGSSVGGAGGMDYGSVIAPTAGQPALGGGQPGGNGAPCTAGSNGANGPAGATPPTPGAAGTLQAGVWTPAAGGDATSGGIGQGGGGGGAYSVYSGGGGGCGGCGSSGGTGGKGGGASIGVLALDSGVFLIDTKIETAAGGAGGKGGVAPAAQGGGGGQANIYGYGCAGGTGGTGGKGGDGGGGAGGMSIGIMHKGTAPVVDTASDAKFRIGAAGAVGIGGVPGPAGVSQKVWPITP